MSNKLLKLYVLVRDLVNSEEGQDLVEYALLISLIALVCIGSISSLAPILTGMFTNVGGAI